MTQSTYSLIYTHSGSLIWYCLAYSIWLLFTDAHAQVLWLLRQWIAYPHHHGGHSLSLLVQSLCQLRDLPGQARLQLQLLLGNTLGIASCTVMASGWFHCDVIMTSFTTVVYIPRTGVLPCSHECDGVIKGNGCKYCCSMHQVEQQNMRD